MPGKECYSLRSWKQVCFSRELESGSPGAFAKVRSITCGRIFVAVASAATVVAAAPALAGGCNFANFDTKWVEGATTDTNHLRGFRAKITSTDVTPGACYTVRSIAAMQNGNNLIELGWLKIEGDGYPHTVFGIRVEHGVIYPTGAVAYLYNRHPNNGTVHTYKLGNANGGTFWDLIYDGDQLDTLHAAFVAAPTGITNSEKKFPVDVLNAHFQDVETCVGGGCSFQTPGNYHLFVNNTASWRFCKVSNRESYVKESSC